MVRPIELILIGAGNIGVRHLQGLGCSSYAVRAYVVDPSPQRLALALREAGRLQNVEVILVQHCSGLPPVADIAIVATSARERAEALDVLLDRVQVAHVVLEKVAFQSSRAFGRAEAFLRAAGVDAWVNCPRRLWPFYRTLRQSWDRTWPFHLIVRGRHFGLACNAVHMVDVLQFLSGSPDVTLSDATLVRVVQSKRAGYYECFGHLAFSASTGARVDIVCEEDGPDRLEWSWISIDGPVPVCEATGLFEDAARGVAFDVGRAPFQSELTGKIVDDLIERRTCELAGVSESRNAHAVLFEALSPFFEANGFDVTRGIPIT